LHELAGLNGARLIAVSAEGASVYVASGEGDALAVFHRDATTGAVTWRAASAMART